jgi:hypothetical protein
MVLAFGAEPGAPLPHAYSYGAAPTEQASFTMRVPIFEREVAPVFPDSELTVETATKIVKRVRIERAYKSLVDCGAAKAVVEKKLAAAMPTPYTGPDPGWRYAKGGALGRLECVVARHLPYPVLTLELATAPPP